MQTKLTLRLDSDLIRKTKTYSRRRGKSVSAMVGDFFAFLDEGRRGKKSALTPTVRSLLGALGDKALSESEADPDYPFCQQGGLSLSLC